MLLTLIRYPFSLATISGVNCTIRSGKKNIMYLVIKHDCTVLLYVPQIFHDHGSTLALTCDNLEVYPFSMMAVSHKFYISLYKFHYNCSIEVIFVCIHALFCFLKLFCWF